MDSSLFSFVQKFSLTGKSLKVDDDLIDRLNHHYTVSLLLIFTVIISAKQYMGSPIQCWIPQHYPDSWEAYAENYCWVKNTYFVKDQIPANRNERRDGEIGYYQWVPFVLALQAFMFYLPVLFWRLSYWHTGIDVQDIVAKACQVPSCRTLKERRDAAEIIATLLKSSIRLATSQSRSWIVRMQKVLFFTCGGHRRGNVLALLYLFVKLLYLVNVIGQIFLLNYFLDAEQHMFGFRLLDNLIRGHDWQMTGIFPRITYCDFRMRSIGQGRPQTIQCVLPMNLFNEKIYICLWIWFVIVAVLTLFNTVKWLAEVCYRPSATGFVLQHLRVANVQGLDEEGADHDIRRLVENEIKNDGMFVLRLINSNASYTVVCMILKRLWNDRNKPKME